MKPNTHAQRGFKLWEVLVVLLIILIVAAILFPVFAKVHRHPGRRGSCSSSEKQLGLAFIQYVQDYDEKWPTGTQSTNLPSMPQHIGLGWGGQIYTYVKATGLYQCPGDENMQPPKSPKSLVSYAYNSNIASVNGKDNKWMLPGDPIKIVVLFEVSNAAADVTQVDEGAAQGATTFSPAGNGLDGYLFSVGNGGRGPAQYATGYLGGRAPSPAPGQFPTPTGRHMDGSNFLLADGHVKWLRPAAVSSGWDAATANSPQIGTTLGHAAGTADTAHVATFSTR